MESEERGTQTAGHTQRKKEHLLEIYDSGDVSKDKTSSWGLNCCYGVVMLALHPTENSNM